MTLVYYTDNNGYYISTNTDIDKEILEFLLGKYTLESKLKDSVYTEIGPLPNFRSPWCTNAISIFEKCGIHNIDRIEKTSITSESHSDYDRLTEMDYTNNVNFSSNKKPENYNVIALNKINQYDKKMSLSLDETDINYYTNLFKKYGRHPTDIELYDLAQSNSEHSRHSFFNGKMIIKDSYIEQYQSHELY